MRHVVASFVAFALCLSGSVARGVADEPAPPGAGPWTLEGRVIGEGGQPIKDAVIRFRPVASDDEQGRPRTEALLTRTGEGGRFSSGESTAHRFDVLVHAEGYAFWTGRDLDPSQPLSVSLERGVPLTGRVLAETTGDGIAGATVRLCDTTAFDLDGSELEASTDVEGRYTYAHAPVGAVWIRASAEGRATRTIRERVVPVGGDAAPTEIDDIWLPVGGSVSGRVVNTGGTPVADVKLLLAAVDGFMGNYRNRFRAMTTHSDEHGRFNFDGVTAGTRYKVYAESDRYAPGVAGPLSIDSGTVLDDVTLTLQAGASLRLRLLDPDEEPVDQVTIRLEAADDPSSGSPARRMAVSTGTGKVVIDEKGWLTASRLPAGAYVVRLEPVDWAPLSRKGVMLTDGETTDLGPITLEPASTLHARVVDADGEPVASAEIVVSWRDLLGGYSRAVSCEDDGSFSVGGVPEFPLAVTANAAGFAEEKLTQLRAGDEPVVVKLKRQGVIHGRVKLATGTAPPLFSVQAIPGRSSRSPAVASDGSNGSFEFEGLDPGTYAVLIRAPGNARGRIDGLELRDGATLDAGEIQLEFGRRLAGRVVREDTGAACPGARIRLDRGAGPPSWNQGAGDVATITDTAGRFAVEGLETKRYTLTLDHPDFAPLQRSVDLDPETETTELELRLGAGGEIRGTVTDADGLPVHGADVFMFRGMRGFDRRMVATRADGTFHFPRVAAGTYIVMRSRTGSQGTYNSQVRTIDVKDGKTVHIKFAD